ncbi:unnamed protein product [Cunninghamella blakesleeana]
MGQHPSKQHSPATFGYINSNNNNGLNTLKNETELVPETTTSSLDQVLTHPELYRLEMLCECNYNSTAIDVSEYMSDNSKTRKACEKCKKLARLSIIQQNLAKELEYIDETYYSGENNYKLSLAKDNEEDHDNDMNKSMIINNIMDDHHHDHDEHVDEGWSKITVGDVSSQTSRNATHQLDGHSNTSIGAKLSAAQPSALTLDLSNRSLVKLSYGIGYLTNLTKLNLSHNQLVSLPKSIGYLKNLTVLNASNNQLEALPDTVFYLTKLKALNISHNNLKGLPACLGSLPSLIIIMANNNQIKRVPHQIANLQKMISFTISNNPITTLPAELATIKSLRKLVADECQFTTEFVQEGKHDPPSLLEICARKIVKEKITKSPYLPSHLNDYLESYQPCSHCHGPYFESYVTRGRFIERIARQPIALEYRLCSAHWSDDHDRLLSLFSSPPSSKSSSKSCSYTHPSNKPSSLNEPSPSSPTSLKKDYSSSSLSTMASSSSASSSLLATPPSTSPSSFIITNNRKRSFSYSSSSTPYHHHPSLPPIPSSSTTTNTPFHTIHSTNVSSSTVCV